MSTQEDFLEAERISLAQLRAKANSTPQPWAVQVQLESLLEKQTAAGAPYFEAKLTDGSDQLLWRIFDNQPAFAEARRLKAGAFLEVQALWVDAGKYGIEPKQARLRALSAQERADLLAGDPKRRELLERDATEVLACIAAMTDPRLRALCQAFWQRHGERFMRCAAARENHHARRGGLLEHVAQMMRSAAALCGVYPGLNRDLLCSGVLFHDCGKLWENQYPEEGFVMGHHLHGEMLGHISMGLELVNKLWREISAEPAAAEWDQMEPSSELVRLHLLHLIASHHGEYEYGSPVLPKTPEALALHYIDNLDAKLEMARRVYAGSRELAPGIFERLRPWNRNLVEPLPRPTALEMSADPEPG
jgi:3'-5' exoribonuclease